MAVKYTNQMTTIKIYATIHLSLKPKVKTTVPTMKKQLEVVNAIK